LLVYSDGASRGNPGPAGAGAVISEPGGAVLRRLGRFLGSATNNVAEYEGLLLGLAGALEGGAREVHVRADSELLIRQLEGRYQVKHPALRPLFQKAKALLARFDRVRLEHVPRAQNAQADEMSNRAIDEKM
jgi:ribonuclease HI